VELPDFETFWPRGYAETPEPDEPYVLFEDFHRDPQAHPLKTASGKVELWSPTIADYDHADCPGQATWFEPPQVL
jgi:biotin/methionine sulfoxide reductase